MKGSEVLRTSSPENATHPGTRGCEKPGKEKKKGMGLSNAVSHRTRLRENVF